MKDVMHDNTNNDKPNVLPTNMLYMSYEGNFQTECLARVVHVSESLSCSNDPNGNGNSVVSIVLDQTVMHAQGGGQPTDTGKLMLVTDDSDEPVKTAQPSPSTIEVTKVVLDRETGIAYHHASLPYSSNNSNSIQVGDTVRVQIDQDRRRLLSECHTAGHVVDAAMAKIGKNLKSSKAYHFLEGPYVEYLGSIDPNEKEQVQSDLQTAFCELVQADIATEIHILSKEEAHALCSRNPGTTTETMIDVDTFTDPRTDQIRVVTVANFSCPCGGTHVRSTGDLQANQWRIKDIKSKKGIVRVRYEQGNITNKKNH